jgi:hypothetical protein
MVRIRVQRDEDERGSSTTTEITSVNQSWQSQVLIRARQLEHGLARVKAAGSKDAAALAEQEITADSIAVAREIVRAAPRPMAPRWFMRWSSGADVEAAWAVLHEGEAALLMCQPDAVLRARIGELREGIATSLSGDGRATGYVEVLSDLEKSKHDLTDEDRAELREIKEAIDSTSDTAHTNVRNYRNWLLIVAGVVLACLVLAALAHGANQKFIFIPEAGKQHFGADVAQLEAAGALGGLLMAIFALVRLSVYSGPVALPMWQALVRIPSGAVAGLVGAALLQGNLFTALQPQSRSSLLAYAFLFGAAPEIVLRLLDNKVNEATAAAAPKNDPAKSSGTAAAAAAAAKRANR